MTALVPGGGYANYCVAHETNALPIPAGLTAAEAAAISHLFHRLDECRYPRGLRAGETLLVHRGTSGIGTTAVPLAKAFGARVVATAGSDEKAAQCERLGADLGVNYRKDDFVALTLRATAGAASAALASFTCIAEGLWDGAPNDSAKVVLRAAKTVSLRGATSKKQRANRSRCSPTAENTLHADFINLRPRDLVASLTPGLEFLADELSARAPTLIR